MISEISSENWFHENSDYSHNLLRFLESDSANELLGTHEYKQFSEKKPDDIKIPRLLYGLMKGTEDEFMNNFVPEEFKRDFKEAVLQGSTYILGHYVSNKPLTLKQVINIYHTFWGPNKSLDSLTGYERGKASTLQLALTYILSEATGKQIGEKEIKPRNYYWISKRLGPKFSREQIEDIMDSEVERNKRLSEGDSEDSLY